MRFLSPRLLRNYSTPKTALTLWVKHNERLNPIEVPLEGCTYIDDFAQKVKQKINANCQVGLFTSLDKEFIKPGLKIKDVLKTDDFKNNSSESPLFAKFFPVTLDNQDSITAKTIYIRDIDDEYRPIDSYTEVLVESDADIKDIYENKGSALYHIAEPKKLLTKLKQLKDGEKYDVFSRYYRSFYR